MYWSTSFANFKPISNILWSESCSFAYAQRKSASGIAIETIFLKILKSNDEP